jgi:hypothetical protein
LRPGSARAHHDGGFIAVVPDDEDRMSAVAAPSLNKLTTSIGMTISGRFRSRDVLSRELAARHPPSLSSSVAQLHGASAGSITDAEAVSLRAPSPERGAMQRTRWPLQGEGR